MTIHIVGAGMAGLLAGRLLARRGVTVYEKQSSLPNNHSAVLRFRTNVVAQSTGIPFRRVTMIKTGIGAANDVAGSLAYAMKCNGEYRSDRSFTSKTEIGDRFIAPPDFIKQLAEGQDIELESDFWDDKSLGVDGPVISTIPMPTLAKLLGYQKFWPETFKYQTGTNVKFKVRNCDAFATVYDARPGSIVSRMSVTGDEVVCECPRADIMDFGPIKLGSIAEDTCKNLGLVFRDIIPGTLRTSLQKYSKITPIDEKARKDFIYWATDKHGIYSLGRYATWRPGLLLDELVEDIQLIDNWIHSGSNYDVVSHRR